MANTRSNRAGGTTTTIMAVLAVVCILGLMFYLSRASTASVQAAPGDDAGGGDMGPTAPPVAAATFGAGMQTYVGQDIDLQGVNVAQVMSPEIIWIDLPTPQGSTPFPVKLAPGSTAPLANTVVNVEGRVLEKTDSIVSAWQASGAIQADQRAQADYGMYFIDAKAVRPAR